MEVYQSLQHPILSKHGQDIPQHIQQRLHYNWKLIHSTALSSLSLSHQARSVFYPFRDATNIDKLVGLLWTSQPSTVQVTSAVTLYPHITVWYRYFCRVTEQIMQLVLCYSASGCNMHCATEISDKAKQKQSGQHKEI